MHVAEVWPHKKQKTITDIGLSQVLYKREIPKSQSIETSVIVQLLQALVVLEQARTMVTKVQFTSGNGHRGFE